MESKAIPLRGGGGTDRKERLFVRVKKYRIMFISVYFLLVWGAALYLCSQNKNYMGQKEDIEKTENKIIFIRERTTLLPNSILMSWRKPFRMLLSVVFNEAIPDNDEICAICDTISTLSTGFVGS